MIAASARLLRLGSSYRRCRSAPGRPWCKNLAFTSFPPHKPDFSYTEYIQRYQRLPQVIVHVLYTRIHSPAGAHHPCGSHPGTVGRPFLTLPIQLAMAPRNTAIWRSSIFRLGPPIDWRRSTLASKSNTASTSSSNFACSPRRSSSERSLIWHARASASATARPET